jgi:hypothetical protein
MNGIDYNKSLSRERELHWKNMRDQQKAHKEEVENMQRTHEHVEESQRTAYNKDKLATEKSFHDRYDKIQESQKEALYEKNRDYVKATEQQKSDFHDSSRKTQHEFQNRMTSLRNEFDQNNDELKQTHKNIQGNLKKNYDSRVSSIRENADRDLKEYQQNALGSNEDNKLKSAIERKQLIDGFDKERNQLIKSEISKRNLLKERAIADIAEMRKNREEERLTNMRRQKEKFEKIVDDSNQKVDETQKKMGAEVNRMAKVQAEEIKSQNKAFTERYKDQEQRYNKNVKDLELANRRNGIGKGSLQYEINQERKKIEAAQLENQKKLLLDERNFVVKDTSEKLVEANEQFQNHLKKEKIDHATKMEEQKWRLTKSHSEEQIKDRLEREDLRQSYDRNVSHLKDVSHEQLMNEKDLSKKRIESLKENFKKGLTKALNNSEKRYDQLKLNASIEQKEMSKRLNEQNSEQKAYLRKVMGEKMDKLSLGYEQRILHLENQNKELRQHMEDSIATVMRNTQAEIERQQEAAKKATDNEVRTQKEISRQKINQLKQSIATIHSSYNGKMNEIRLQSQKKLKQANFKFDQMIQSERKKYQEIIDQNNRFYEREKARVNSANDAEKQRLITQYENQIKKMQDVFQRKQVEIEHFNQLNRA